MHVLHASVVLLVASCDMCQYVRKLQFEALGWANEHPPFLVKKGKRKIEPRHWPDGVLDGPLRRMPCRPALVRVRCRPLLALARVSLVSARQLAQEPGGRPGPRVGSGVAGWMDAGSAGLPARAPRSLVSWCSCFLCPQPAQERVPPVLF